jgi:transcriptional regulator with XRE-family HTH domain
MASSETRVGETLRRIRREHRLSLRHVAEQAGISVATLSRVETSKQSVDVTLLLALARILRVSVADLVGDHGNGDGDAPRREPKRLEQTMDDLLATLDLVRNELANVHRDVKRGKSR